MENHPENNQYDEKKDKNVAKKIQNMKKRGLQKNIFSYLLNLDLGHLQPPADENKMVIGKISIRAIQKLSYFDQQTIVDGPNFNLTNGKISYFFSLISFSQENHHFTTISFDFPIILIKIMFCFSFFIDSNQ